MRSDCLSKLAKIEEQDRELDSLTMSFAAALVTTSDLLDTDT